MLPNLFSNYFLLKIQAPPFQHNGPLLKQTKTLPNAPSPLSSLDVILYFLILRILCIQLCADDLHLLDDSFHQQMKEREIA